MEEYKIINKNNKRYIQFKLKNEIPNYVIYMHQENKISNIMNMYIDENNSIIYDISKLQSIKSYFVTNGATLENIMVFMNQYNKLLKNTKEYLISENHILLNENHIYTNGEFSKVFFLLYSHGKKDKEETITKLFKFIIGNYLICKSFNEIRIREDILKYFKNHKYDYTIINKMIKEIQQLKPTKITNNSIKVNFNFKKNIINKFNKKNKYNDSTCEIRNIEGVFCLTNILDITKKLYLNEEGIIINRMILIKDYDIHNKKIGRYHARVYMEQGKILIFDLGSKNGTYINGERISKRIPCEIEKGDIVAFADEEFIVC